MLVRVQISPRVKNSGYNMDLKYHFIAEIGLNHDGEESKLWEIGKRLFLQEDVEYIKLQLFHVGEFFHPYEFDAAKGGFLTRANSWFEEFQSLQLPDSVLIPFLEECRAQGKKTMGTIFDLKSLEKYAPYLDALKIASSDINYLELISACAKTKKPLLISTGMAIEQEILRAKEYALAQGTEKLVFLHCISQYPVALENAHLEAIPQLKNLVQTEVGFSDHTLGQEAILQAVEKGAHWFEKHITYETRDYKWDHILSMEPEEYGALAQQVCRQKIHSDKLAEESSLPSFFVDSREDRKNSAPSRRGIYFHQNMTQKQTIRREDILILRPCVGIESDQLEHILGKKLKKDIKAYQVVHQEDIIE